MALSPERELELLFRGRHRQEVSDREREVNIYRSGSAPPTVEGSLAAIGGLFGPDEELRSDPAYLSYYYSHVNLNPRLPPPVLSKEDWRFSQRVNAGLGGIGDKRRSNRGEEEQGGSNSLFSMQPPVGGSVAPARENGGDEWLGMGGDGFVGSTRLAPGRERILTDMFQQDDLGLTTPVSSRPVRPTSRNVFGNGIDLLGSAEAKLALQHDEIRSLDSLQSGGVVQNVAGVQHNSVLASRTFASVLGKSLSRSNISDPQLVSRSPSPRLPPVGVRIGNTDKKNNGSCFINGVSSSIVEGNDLAASLSDMSLAAIGGINKDIHTQSKLRQEIDNYQKFLFDSQDAQNYTKQNDPEHFNMSIPHLARKTGSLLDPRNIAVRPNWQGELQKPTLSSPNSYLKSPSPSSARSQVSAPAHYPNSDGTGAAFNGYGSSGYLVNPALSSTAAVQVGTNNLPLFENASAGAATAIGSPVMNSRAQGVFRSGSNLSGAAHFLDLNNIGNPTTAAALQMPLVDPSYIQHLRSAEYAVAAQVGVNSGNPSMERGYMGNSYADLLEIQKVYLGALLQPQIQYGMPFIGESEDLNNGYYGNPAFGLGMSYSGSQMSTPLLPGSPVGPGTPLRHGERSIHFPSGLSNFSGGMMGSWHSDSTGHLDGSFPFSLLEEFKSNKTKCYELSDIAGHVVEFSADQYGSRFIQQKLETATVEEKNMVFEEIMPQAFSLMTDVFGNYVVQKFFEHGSASQRRELADQLIGNVLTLSLQMYGCRVIQKAIEVVDLDQQTKMVAELEGHVMRCVRDQNGNHVIQKCIECIPQDVIQFIISSFYDQVVTLSTHPYGCRVIQRVLEHGDDPKVQQIMMDEIMESICMLAQDQYGNYVVQHVLEHGKPHERSAIIKKLAGQIVQMSQQKFASNVVEKCLLFGGPEERQVLVNEILGSTEENEPLQAMMKDQFANYVVQKVLETCDEQQREFILSRIKVHLNALKKYTYGKHIVARVEKLVVAGERRIGVQTPYTALKA